MTTHTVTNRLIGKTILKAMKGTDVGLCLLCGCESPTEYDSIDVLCEKCGFKTLQGAMALSDHIQGDGR